MIKKVLSRIGILFLYLVSLLPFWFLYFLADMMFIVLYYITGYRRKVVWENLSNSFPEKTETELKRIEKKYYKYLADLIVEIIKLISISEQEITKRMCAVNTELMEHYFSQGKSILSVTAHYGNWEMAAARFGLLTNNKRLIIYKPLNNEIFDDFFNKTRSRFGTSMIAMKMALRKFVECRNELTFSVFASDQTPVPNESLHFTKFLNQPTAVFPGIEKISQIRESVVVFYRIDYVKRGYYTGTIVPLFDNPKDTRPFEITERHVAYLESMIREKPEYWLWSHRRWKLKPH